MFTQSELEAYLDEDLAADEMARVEDALRSEPQLAETLAALNVRRDSGMHSVGGIWRRARISCPTREQLGSFLLQAVDGAHADYIRFHVETIGCRACQANLEDLRQQQEEAAEVVDTRRRKYFQSSAGYLKKGK